MRAVFVCLGTFYVDIFSVPVLIRGRLRDMLLLRFNLLLSASALILLSCSSVAAFDLNANLEKARRLLKESGSSVELLRISEEILSYSENAEAYYYRGLSRSELGNVSGALDDYSKALELMPDNLLTLWRRASLMFDSGDHLGAIKDLDRAIGLKPNLVGLHRNRAAAKYRLGDLKGAVDDWSIEIRIHPKDFDSYYNRGVALEKAGDLEGACRDWAMASSLGDVKSSGIFSRQCR